MRFGGAVFAIGILFMEHTTEDIALYERQTQEGVMDPFPYDRLMIHYRKEKAYRKELQLVKRAIKIFSDQLKMLEKQLFAGAKSRAAIKKLSDKINRSAGLVDKKGNLQWLPE